MDRSEPKDHANKGSGVFSKSFYPTHSAECPSKQNSSYRGFFTSGDAEIKVLSVIEREQRAQDDEAKTGTRSIIVRVTGRVIDARRTVGIRVETRKAASKLARLPARLTSHRRSNTDDPCKGLGISSKSLLTNRICA